MPTVLREKGYRFVFYPSDRGERPHVHVIEARRRAKLWLEPGVSVASAGRYSDHEINEIVRITEDQRDGLLGTWRRFLG